MIHKVNRPEFRLVVNSPKQAENDPGSSQGGGVAYEKFSKAPQQTPSKSEENEASSDETGNGHGISHRSELEIRAQIDLDQLVLEYHGAKRASGSSPGLTVHYHREGGQSKGLLLNKKAE